MPKISEKGHLMPSSPIRKLVPFAEEARRKGVNVIYLNIGQPDIKTPEIALEELKHINLTAIEYSHSAGNISLRTKLVESYKKHNINITTDDVIITTGGSEAITFAFMATLDIGDEIIIPEPFYANYNGFATQANVIVKPITSTIENNFALPAISEFEKLITPKTKGIVIGSPNNPTGCLYSKEEILALAELVKKHNLYLYSDEVYREFCYDGQEHFSAMNIPGLEENVIMIDSFSKTYSMCGIRVGCMVTRNKEVYNTVMKFAQARLSPPSLGQIVAEKALETPQSYFDEVQSEYVKRRNFMIEELNKIEGVYCPMPKGAFYSILRLPIDDADKFLQWMLQDFQYNNNTLMLAPATGFYNTPGLGKNEARVAYVLKIEDLKIAIETLKKALEVYPGRTI